MQIANLDMCSGCGACVAVCPKNAIDFKEDRFGQKFPKIDQNKCIDCHLCEKTCPINHEFFIPKLELTKCYALQGRNKGHVEGCSSGGVATIIARHIIEQGGYVFGCKFDENMDLNYVECSTLYELELIKGSKYVQSNLTQCYVQIKKRLVQGKKVLVIGLPCQIAGVKGYLKKDYENLFLIDLICHGTPPVRYLKEHVERLGYAKIENIKFREKKGFILTLFDNKKSKIFSVRSACDEYYSGFLNGIIYRENCYKCPYANPYRVSDITLGDFWGLDKETLVKKYEGAISVGLVHTEKGAAIFEEICDQIVYEERKIEEALEENGQLREPMKPDEHDRRVFLQYYPVLGFDRAFRKTKLYKKKVLVSKCKNCIVKTRVGKNLKELWRKIK